MNGSDGTAGLEKQDFMKDLFKFGRLLVAAAVLTCAAGCSDDKDGSGGGPELPVMMPKVVGGIKCNRHNIW